MASEERLSWGSSSWLKHLRERVIVRLLQSRIHLLRRAIDRPFALAFGRLRPFPLSLLSCSAVFLFPRRSLCARLKGTKSGCFSPSLLSCSSVFSFSNSALFALAFGGDKSRRLFSMVSDGWGKPRRFLWDGVFWFGEARTLTARATVEKANCGKKLSKNTRLQCRIDHPMYPLQKIDSPRRRGRRLPVQGLHLTRIRYVPAAHRFDSPLRL